MTANTTPTTDDEAPTDSLTDPAALADLDGVSTGGHTFEHGTTDHCAAGTAGRAVVGVLDGDGALLVLEHDDTPHPILPNDTVAPGGDWAAVARDVGEMAAGVPVELEAPRAVRHVEHVLEAEDDPHEEGVHVVFEATPTGPADDDAFPDGCDWSARWTGTLPDAAAGRDAPEAADLRLFLG